MSATTTSPRPTEGPLMLKAPLLIEDAMTRGIHTSQPDGAEVCVFDSRYAFVIFTAKAGIAQTVLRGPFYPSP